MPRNGRDDFPLVEALKWYIEYLRGQNSIDANDETDPRVATVRLKNAQAEKYELENALRRNELLEQAEVMTFFEEVSVMFANAFDNFEGRLTGPLVEATGGEAKAIAPVIAKESNAARADIAAAMHALAERWERDVGGEDATEETG